jgi:hypothetical protein
MTAVAVDTCLYAKAPRCALYATFEPEGLRHHLPSTAKSEALFSYIHAASDVPREEYQQLGHSHFGEAALVVAGQRALHSEAHEVVLAEHS